MQKRTIQVLAVLLFIGLLLWGGYSTIAYFGVPTHAAVLLSDATKELLKGRACSESLFTCGLIGLVPAILHTLSRAADFAWYAVLSFLAVAFTLGVVAVRRGSWPSTVRITPAGLIASTLALLWLMFTVLSNSQTENTAMRILAEPSPAVYADASPSVLAELKRNFDSLDQRGCLTLIGSYTNGAKAYSMKTSCIQISFFTRVFPPFLFVLFLLFELLVLGRMLLHLVRFPDLTGLSEFVISAGVGVCGWVALLWSLAVAHLIIMPMAWVLVILIPILGYRHSLHWLRQSIRGKEVTLRWAALLLLWLLVSYLALNFLTVVRPFPIGWDDLGSYLNRPRLMISYGSFIFSMAPFQWEYLTSLGFLLFGYNNVFGATTSMMVNWFAGLLAVLSVYAFARTFFGEGRGLLSALLYYTLPLVGHFSFADMKVDNGVFSMGALGAFALFLGLFPSANQEDQEPTLRTRLFWVALAGVFFGFGFAMKPTVIMVIMAMGAVFLGVSLHWTAFAGALALILALFMHQGTLNLSKIAQRVGFADSLSIFITIGTFLLGIVGIGFAFFLARNRTKKTLLSGLVFGAAFLCSITPWVWHNNILIGHIIPTSLEFGAPNILNPSFDLDGKSSPGANRPYRPLPPELRIDRSQPACKITGGTEELDRYWGYGKGWSHYLTLPWRTVMNADSIGYYVTTIPALLLFPLLLLLPYFWMRKGRWLKWLAAGTAFIVFEWMFLANGIPWYGIAMFLGLVVGLEALIVRAPDIFSRSAAAILISLSLISAFSMRLWQFDVQRNMLEYAVGKISAEALMERTISHYDDVSQEVVKRSRTMPDRPYLYRIGTFIPYFIPRNLEVIGISDHQLDFFNCLYAERDAALTLKRLKALGFNSIVFDTNTATIEKDQNGTLHQKVNAFIEFANTPSNGLVTRVNDNDAGLAFMLIP